MMRRKKAIRKERLLAYSWIAAYVLFGVIVTAIGRSNIQNGLPEFQLATPSYTIIVLILMFVFYPWLYFVRIYAKRAAWKPAVFLSTAFLCLLTIWLIASVILTVLAFFDVIGPTDYMH